MELEEALAQYPEIARWIWPKIVQDAGSAPRHPVRLLLVGDSTAARRVAYRTDEALAQVHDHDPQWLRSKVAVLRSDTEFSAAVALLSEVRAYSALLAAFRRGVAPRHSGTDFCVSLSNQLYGVEVYSPQHSDRASTEPEVSSRGGLETKLFWTAPFGLPQRAIDTVQGEAVSRLAQAKQDEAQFQGGELGVLWLDLQDPSLWGLLPDLGQAMPFTTFRNSATSGALWSAFYGRKGTPVFDSLSFGGGDHSIYRMEFEGRFYQPTVLSLVVVSLVEGILIYQNPNESSGCSPELFRALHLLPDLRPELSWIDWPLRGRLIDRVDSARATLEAYVEAFKTSW